MTFVMKYRKEILLIVGNLIAFLIVTNELTAQDRSGYIYGRVTTYSNEYVGQIRWGDEEAIWLDMFNAEKTEKSVEVNKGDDYLITSIWKDNKSHSAHQFNCQFGDIKEITSIGKSRLTLIHKDGTKIALNGSGYNDASSTLRVEDDELGLVKVSWSKIKKIEFFEARTKGALIEGEHLYGKVSTYRKGDFEGYIIWDKDERLGEEKLDGDVGSDDVSIPFKNIVSIKSRGDGSDVKLKSGRELYMDDSNDVDNGNRGIIVMDPEVGYIQIPWSYFDKVEFSEPKKMVSYNDFKKPKGIFGQVYTTNNKSYSGRLAYDLDEYWEYEIIEGKDDKIEYNIPIRHIQRIEPKNDSYSEIQLKNGKTLLLGKLRDVSGYNAGILVMSGNQKPKYIEWEDVLEIVFE